MKKLVIYVSKYGSTKQYAEWIAENLACEAVSLKDIKKYDLSKYDTLIYGGYLYAGSIKGFKKFLKTLKKVSSKNIVLFTVGITDLSDEEAYGKIREQNIPMDLKDKIKVFHFRGNQKFSTMSGFDRTMMKVPYKMISKIPKQEQTEEHRRFLETYGQDVEFANKQQIESLIGFITNSH